MESTVDLRLPYITNIINLAIEEFYFSEKLKLAEVSLISIKKNNLDKENYKSVSVLLHVPITSLIESFITK